MEIFKLFGSIFVDNEKANESISKTDGKAKTLSESLGNGIKNVAKFAVGVGTAAAAGAAALYGMATKSAEATDKIDKMSQKMGISREAYQEFDFICSQSGMSVDALKGGMKTLTSAMDGAVSGTKNNVEQFKRLGVEVKNTDGSLRSQEDVLMETLSALQGMENQTEKSRLATELFGKSGQDLMPLLNGASGSIDTMKQQAHDLGLVLSDESIDAGVKFTDTIDQLKRSFSAATTEIGVGVMPMIQSLADWVIANMPTIQAVIGVVFDFISLGVGIVVDFISMLINKFQEWSENNQETIDKIMGYFGVLWDYLKSLFEDIKIMLEVFWEYCKGFWDKYGQSIIAIIQPIWEAIKVIIKTALDVIKSIIKLFTDIFKGDWSAVWEDVKNIFSSIWEGIKDIVPTLIGAVVNAFKLCFSLMFDAGKGLFNAIWDGMKSIWTNLCNWVNEKVAWLVDKLSFWKSSSDEMSEDKSSGVNGSHAAGLAYVPFNGYKAELHEGERVLTASENNGGLAAQIVNGLSAVLGSRGTGSNQPITLQVILDGREMAKAIYEPLKQEKIRLGEV